MTIQYLGRILLFICTINLLSCLDANNKLDPKPLNPVEINLTKQYMYVTSEKGNYLFYEWRAEVSINNRSKDTIIITKYINSDVLLSRVTCYKIYENSIKKMNFYPEGPFTTLDTLAPNNMKTFLVDLPMGKAWVCPDTFYINFSIFFIADHMNNIISPNVKHSIGNILEPGAVYNVDFNYIIDKGCSRVRPIEEHVDSIFKNRVVVVDNDFY